MLNRVLIIFLLSICTQAMGNDYVDSLETKLILVDDTSKLKLLDKIIPYYFRNEPLQASRRANKMLAIAREINNKEYEIKAQRYVGLSDSRLTSDHEKALKKCLEAENEAKSNGLAEELILTKLAYADIYQHIGDDTRALESQLDAYHLADSIQQYRLIAMSLNSQARSYIGLEDYYKAEQCVKKAIKLSKIHDQQDLLADAHVIFGDLYAERYNYPLALEHYQLAHKLYVSLHKDVQIAIAIFKTGDCHYSMDQMDTAFQYHLNALTIRNRIKDGTGLAESYNKIGLLCIEKGEFQRAINNIRIGLRNAERINSNRLMQQSFDFLYQAYLGLDDFKKAIFYQNKYTNISELIYSEASEKRIEKINTQHEIELRDQQIRNLQDVSQQNEQQLAISQKFNVTLILLMLVSGLLVLIFVRSYRERKRINRKLQLVNQQMVEQNKELIEVNSTKDKFFSIIGHDLKGPLNSLTSFSQLLINHTAMLTEEEIRTIATDLDKSLKNLYELLENLLSWARSQTGRIEFAPEKFDITEVIQENIRLLAKAAVNKQITIDFPPENPVEVFADINSIRTIIRNLLSNAIKFTDYKGTITISVKEWKSNVDIGIKDTGVGISPADQEKIFSISAKHTTLGTNREKGTGLGLILCREFVERNKGKISIESKVGSGTTFTINLPK